MVERIIPMFITAFCCSMFTAYMYYTNIQPKLDEIIEILKKGEEEEDVREQE